MNVGNKQPTNRQTNRHKEGQTDRRIDREIVSNIDRDRAGQRQRQGEGEGETDKVQRADRQIKRKC